MNNKIKIKTILLKIKKIVDNQWFKDINQCITQGKQGIRYETMTVEPMAKDINIEILKRLDRERINFNQNLFFSQEVTQQKHYSIIQLDNQSEFQKQQNLNQVDKQKITFLQQPLSESTIIPQIQDNHKIIQIDQPELSIIFEDLKNKLSYDYLMDESQFNLYLFQDSIRIMQNKYDSKNFRVYLPIIDATLSGIVMALFDTKTQTKWNKQIQNIEQLENLGLTTVKIKETRLPYEYFYQTRIFTYLRQFYFKNNAIFVIEKSNDKSSSNINWNICAVFLFQNTLKYKKYLNLTLQLFIKMDLEQNFKNSVFLNYSLQIQKQLMVDIQLKIKTYNQQFNIQKNMLIQFHMLWNQNCKHKLLNLFQIQLVFMKIILLNLKKLNNQLQSRKTIIFVNMVNIINQTT